MDRFKEGEDVVVGIVFGVLIKNVGAQWGGEKVRVADVDRTRERLSWSKPSPQEIYLASWRASFCFVVEVERRGV